MLVLTRRERESIDVGDDIKVEYLEYINASTIRIRVTAPAMYAAPREHILKLNDSIQLNTDAHVKLAVISGRQIRLGFTAPKTTKINRSEVTERIKNGEPRKPRDDAPR